MRLSQVLRRQHSGYWFKQTWKLAGKKKIVDVGAVDKLKAAGIDVINALEYTRPKSQQKVTIPEPWNTDVKDIKEHPDWHDKVCHFFTSNTCLLEGQTHAQALTKTLCKSGLPRELEAIYNTCNLSPKAEEQVKYAINHSHIWDAWQVKLPRIIDKERLWFIYKRVYGIPLERQIWLLVNSLLRQCDLHSMEYGDRYLERSLVHDVVASVPIEKDGDILQYRVTIPVSIMADRPLRAFANTNEIEATVAEKLPDIYPIRHTLDLNQENVYTLNNFFSVPLSARHSHPHTIFIHHTGSDDDWSHSQSLGRALGVCYAIANAQARLRFGNVKNLPRPISLQCIQTDGRCFDFIAYQLNSLEHDGTEGVKNLAWIDAGHELFGSCSRSVEGGVSIEGFNASTFRRLLGLYLHGLQNEHDDSRTITHAKSVVV